MVINNSESQSNIQGTPDNDRLLGTNLNDQISGLGGDDRIRGLQGNDTLSGDRGDDLIIGGVDNDILLGKQGNDQLRGQKGDDFLKAGRGDDILDGGFGNDTLVGGQGADQFVLGNDSGTDRIWKYEDGEDRFLLEDGLTFGQLEITPVPGGTSIRVAASGERLAFVNGVDSEVITAEDFVIYSNGFEITTVAQGLFSPRGIAVWNDDLYVVEVGEGGDGPILELPERGVEYHYGATGAITIVKNGVQDRIVTGLPSLQEVDSATGEIVPGAVTGIHDLIFDSEGNAYVIIGYGNNPESRATFGEVGNQFSYLYQSDNLESGLLTPVVDLGLYEEENNPDQGGIDTNPYSMTIAGDSIFVADAGANDVLEIDKTTLTLESDSVFPTRNIPFNGNEIPMQSVPTSVTVGPDGAIYVGELTGFPFPTDAARVYRLETAGAEPTVYAEGFTHIMDLGFDNLGNLYVLEHSQDSLLVGNPRGALIQVAPDGTKTTISGDELIFPTDLYIDEDNNIYVANNGRSSGAGEVLRYSYGSSELPQDSLGDALSSSFAVVSDAFGFPTSDTEGL